MNRTSYQPDTSAPAQSRCAGIAEYDPLSSPEMMAHWQQRRDEILAKRLRKPRVRIAAAFTVTHETAHAAQALDTADDWNGWRP